MWCAVTTPPILPVQMNLGWVPRNKNQSQKNRNQTKPKSDPNLLCHNYSTFQPRTNPQSNQVQKPQPNRSQNYIPTVVKTWVITKTLNISHQRDRSHQSRDAMSISAEPLRTATTKVMKESSVSPRRSQTSPRV